MKSLDGRRQSMPDIRPVPFPLPDLGSRRSLILLALLASLALVFAIPLQFLRVLSRSGDYAFSAGLHEHEEQNAREAAKQSHEEWRAKYNETRAALASGRIASDYFHGPEDYFSPPPDFQRKLAEYHRQLKEKYEWASDHPWQSVVPDPPKPHWRWDREPRSTPAQ